MVRREDILEIIGSVERRDTPVDPENTTILPASQSNWSTNEIINELFKDGYIEGGDLGNIYLLGDSGLKVNIVLTRKGRLLYERYSTSISKDEQIKRLFSEGNDEMIIARLVDSSIAYVRLVIEDLQGS